MGANEGVLVSGMVTDDEHGLAEAQGEWKEHSKKVGDALLNVSGIDTFNRATGERNVPVKVHEPRLPYDVTKNQWPKAAYHADGRFETAADHVAMELLKSAGFREQPYPRAQVAVNDPAGDKKKLQAELAEKTGQITALTEKYDQLAEMFQKAMAKFEGDSKKK